MAIYRTIYMNFWKDTKIVDDFTPEDKYFMLYCLTNDYTNLCGCFEISTKQIAIDTGYNVETIERLLERFEKVHKIISYNKQNKEMLIKNWYKYNWTKSDKIDKPLLKEIEKVKTVEFKAFLVEKYNQRDTVSIPYPYPMDTSVADTVTDTVTDAKKKFEEFYNKYPRKVKKQEVEKWFKKNKPSNELFSSMMNSLEQFRASKDWQKDGGQFIPYPSTWLNQKRWEDEINKPQQDDSWERWLKEHDE